MTIFSKINIHGDNIVECERTIDLIREACSDSSYVLMGPKENPVCPIYEIYLEDKHISTITLFPGYGRWNNDIISNCTNSKLGLREATDIIITRVESQSEIPLIAIEYCGALPAGNQAWQRNGRAFTFGISKIPFFYIAELGGYELTSNREKKSARMPNPAVAFSYLSHSAYTNSATLPIFIPNHGANTNSMSDLTSIYSKNDLLKVIYSILNGISYQISIESISTKTLNFIKKRAESGKNKKNLTADQWEQCLKTISNKKNIVEFSTQTIRLSWSKTAYINDLTNTAIDLMKLSSEFGFGLTSSDLPISVIPKENKNIFAKKINLIYPNLHLDFLKWIQQDKNLVICWVMGFKPKHDDARPDRGLPPLARMIIGEENDLLTVVYGPANPTTWPILDQNPEKLMNNGLWESILKISDGLLVDSSTDQIKVHGYLKSHWSTNESKIMDLIKCQLVLPVPKKIGENDVDTGLHIIFSHGLKNWVFEGMCNPPGGDWSGLSIKRDDIEYRWLTLPRVSQSSAKRPDHVFQLNHPNSKPILLIIESKEKSRSVESDIGTRLESYIINLMNTPPSSYKKNGEWLQNNSKIDHKKFLFVSGIAFLADHPDKNSNAIKLANVDIAFLFKFNENCSQCFIDIHQVTNKSELVIKILESIDFAKFGFFLNFYKLDNQPTCQ